VFTLDLLKSSTEGASLGDVSAEALNAIANERNRLAHGHFDQNPYSGEYDVVTKDKRWQYTVEKLDALSKRANDVWTSLRYAKAYYSFSEPVKEPWDPPDASVEQ
jgi:hypothetical protein